jgi:hypothetical protein
MVVVGSVMVLGCMTASGVGNVNFIEAIVNKHIYVNILREYLYPGLKNLRIKTILHFTMTMT